SDPQLQALADNGGFTQTIAIPGNSSAVAVPQYAGSNDWNGTPYLDQRGYAKRLTGVRAIGAYDPNSKSSFAVNFSSAGNGSLSGTVSQTVAPLGSATAVAANPNTNYTFSGWTGDYVGTENPLTITNVSKDMTVTANFALKTYTVSFAPGTAGGSISGNATQTIQHGGSCTAVTAVADTGYHFVNWNGDYSGTSNPLTISNVTVNKTITANFAINQYTLTYNAGTGGTLTGLTPQTINHGASGTAVTAVANTGYNFSGWSDGVGMASRTDTNVTANKTVTANFAINTYTVTFDLVGKGTRSGGGALSQTINHGSGATAPNVTPNVGWTFTGWDKTFSNIIGDTTVTAQYAVATYTVTFVEGTNGSITGTKVQTVNHGASASSVMAVPNSGYHFVNWTGALTSTSNPLTVPNVTTGMTVTANFTVNTTFANVISQSGLTMDRGNIVDIFDFDKDGDEDLLYSKIDWSQTGIYYMKLMQNNGNSTFTDVTALKGLPTNIDIYTCGGVRAFDIDNDGWMDVVVGKSPGFRIFKNNHGNFTEVTSEYIIDPSLDQVGFPVDFDKDGDLDLIYQKNNSVFIVYQDKDESTGQKKLNRIETLVGTGQCGVIKLADFDNDGDVDLMVIKTGSSFTLKNILYYRNDNGTFVDATSGSGLTSSSSRGFVIWDYNNDGLLDVVIGCEDIMSPPRAFKNNGNGNFSEVTSSLHLYKGSYYYNYHSEGDFDNDGDFDLYWGVEGGGANEFYVNNNGSFTESASTYGINFQANWADGGMPTWFDYDNDGNLDLFVTNFKGNSMLFENPGFGNNYLRINLVGNVSPIDPRGARVVVKIGAKELTQIYGDSGSLSKILHYGLGSAASVDSVKVYWTSGLITEQKNVGSNQVITITESNSPTEDLVAYYPFNGNANDESGNGNNGTVNGATLTDNRFGNANSAYSFDGTNDFISIPHAANLSLTTFTINAWIYDTSNDETVHEILLKGNYPYNYGINTGLAGKFGGTFDSGGVYKEVVTNKTYARNKWHYVTFSHDGTTGKIYMDGVLDNSFACGNIRTNSYPVTIGSYAGSNYFFKGAIDDIRIYSRALSDLEITQLYQSESQDLVAYYPFNGNANDESGNGNNGTVNGATLIADRFENANSAYSFNGNSTY
ncbi:MAG: FG-GAP-like repeat-containing protein, partial [Lentisphaerota bacterium]